MAFQHFLTNESGTLCYVVQTEKLSKETALEIIRKRIFNYMKKKGKPYDTKGTIADNVKYEMELLNSHTVINIGKQIVQSKVIYWHAK